jgi:hypothetical protein
VIAHEEKLVGRDVAMRHLSDYCCHHRFSLFVTVSLKSKCRNFSCDVVVMLL